MSTLIQSKKHVQMLVWTGQRGQTHCFSMTPQDQRLHPCAFFSWRPTAVEVHHDFGNRELLTVVLATRGTVDGRVPGAPHTPLFVLESVRSDAPQWRHSTQRTCHPGLTRTLHSPSAIVLVSLRVPGHQVLLCCWCHVCSGEAPRSDTPPAVLLTP